MDLFSQRKAILLLRLSLGITFFWFGILKLFNASPVIGVIQKSLPPALAESQLFLLALALLEMVIGICLLINKLDRIAAAVMIGHLLIATISVLVTQGFAPRFPVLSFAGEFVIKNLVLIAAGFVLLTDKEIKKEDEKHH